LPLLVASAATAQTTITNGVVTSTPAGPKRVASTVIVAAAVDTAGSAELAHQALLAANKALGTTPGYSPMPTSEYAALTEKDAATAMKDVDYGYPFTSTDFQKIGKASKAPYAMTISVSPEGAGYKATAELYETKGGALKNIGTGVSTAATPEGLDSAVTAAVVGLGQTATFNGVLLSKPGPYMAHITGGELTGLRGGARVEYLENGVPIAYGTVVELGQSSSMATVAPEAAFPSLYTNMHIRIVNNPTEKRALPTLTAQEDKDFKQFERAFTITAAGALAIYYLAIN
jgi:hypothetical protein